MHNHPTADQIYDHIIREYPTISRSTVYRILNQLADTGDIRRVDVGNGANRFDFCVTEHWHIHCIQCDCVEDVEMSMPEALTAAVAKTGFQLVSPYFTLEGLCPICRKKISIS
jgi:Fe2+ or Zn2+ uptake regulation protein